MDNKAGIRLDGQLKVVYKEAEEAEQKFKETAKQFPETTKLCDVSTKELVQFFERKGRHINARLLTDRVMSYKDSSFTSDIMVMNMMMELKAGDEVVPATLERMVKFRNILIDEVNEINQIIAKLDKRPTTREEHVEILADLADVCADIQVYCASENCQHGIDNGMALMTVMDSNYTKLDNGERVWNEEIGKFEKGPNYLAPEPALREAISHAWDMSDKRKAEKE